MLQTIPFNKPYITGSEVKNIETAILNGKLAGDGLFTQKCHLFFVKRYNFKKVLLTTSCTDALEMCALLINTKAGDEIIMPSYTFVSTANAFILRGAKIVFADSEINNPNIDSDKIESLITNKTKAIVVVHYAGVSCDMDKIMALANKHNIFVIEDAAQAIDAFYKNRPLGSIGHLAAFSFHETKNIIAGEAGLLVINDDNLVARAEIIREKGTNRSAFFRGEINKYGWVDIGSSFLPSDLLAAFLFAQLEEIDLIQNKRKEIWNQYNQNLKILQDQNLVDLFFLPEYATHNAHMFYIVCKSEQQRGELIAFLKSNEIFSVFHYLSLHKSPFFIGKHDGRDLPMSDKYSDRLLRLPFFADLTSDQVNIITEKVKTFYLN